jgi:hypothetical protein
VARELRLITWCDGEHGDEDVAATVVRTLSVDGDKPVLLDLCEVCDKTVQDLILFMGRGVPASKAIAAPQARTRRAETLPVKAVAPRPRADGKDRVDCMEEGCGYVGNTRSALGQHLTSKHGTKFSDYDWTPA